MRIFICGVDGYLGWPLALHLLARGHQVFGCDTFLRRRLVEFMGSDSITPIASMEERIAGQKNFSFLEIDVGDSELLGMALRDCQPDAIVHLAEIPSAPYSMANMEQAVQTQYNNVIKTLKLLYVMKRECPQAHLVKLGSMGEYGTPNLDIPEGFFDVEYRGRKDRLPFPKQAGSWYHLSKVHDSHNIEFACKIWGLAATDIMQGVVFGLLTKEIDGMNPLLLTRFDIDEAFGTVINRYCAEAIIGHDLLPYGSGGQTRGFLPLRDSIQCLRLIIENPAAGGEYRVINQLAETHSVNYLAVLVEQTARRLGYKTQITPIDNPRVEMEQHYYNPDHERLLALGYQPTAWMGPELTKLLQVLARYRERIVQYQSVLHPKIRWRD